MTNARRKPGCAEAAALEGREQQAPRPGATAAAKGAPRGLGSRTEKQGSTMTGAQAVVASLEAEGVGLVFGYPGGQAIKIYDALFDSVAGIVISIHRNTSHGKAQISIRRKQLV